MTVTDLPIRVVALYRFTTFADCAALRAPLALACRAAGVRGTLLLAPEGINGTIAGADDAIERILTHIRDQRVAVGHGLAPGSHDLCHGCRMPVGARDRASPLYRAGVSCPACHAGRSEEQRAGYSERHRQTRLATARGVAHVGATFPPDGSP